MIEVFLEQGTPEWFAEKIGKPSASDFNKILTSTGKISESRKGYLYQLAAEAITGESEQTHSSPHMTRGTEMEGESHCFFELATGITVRKTGVCYPDDKKLYLCSPDGLCVEEQAGLEMKNPMAKTHVKYLLDNKLPTDYFCQVHGSLAVTGLDYWYFLSYYPNMQPLLLRVEPDVKWIDKFEVEIVSFVEELNEITKKLRQ